jgi:hypothetical protein
MFSYGDYSMRIQLLILFSCALSAHADPWKISSPARPISLVELYSSEGCSSCPPADKWVSSLRKNPSLWKKFAVMEFHVDYWNRLGWTDRFSKQQFTERQRELADVWGKESVYTPGFVLNGGEWKNPSVEELIKARGDEKKSSGILTVVKGARPDDFAVEFKSPDLHSLTLHAALLGNGFKSDVKSGENSGSILIHDFVVTRLVSLPIDFEKKKKGYFASVTLASPGNVQPQSWSVVFWITPIHSEVPLQVVGGDL